MLIAGLLLGLVAIGRSIVSFAMLAGTRIGNTSLQPFHAVVAVLALAASTAYLGWLALRGRHALHDSPLAESTRNILVGYGVLALVVLPVFEAAVYR